MTLKDQIARVYELDADRLVDTDPLELRDEFYGATNIIRQLEAEHWGLFVKVNTLNKQLDIAREGLDKISNSDKFQVTIGGVAPINSDAWIAEECRDIAKQTLDKLNGD